MPGVGPGAQGGKAYNDISGDVYCELGSWGTYVIHLSKRAVEWLVVESRMFSAYLQLAVCAVEELEVFLEPIKAGIEAETTATEIVSESVSDGRVKVTGVIGTFIAVPTPDEGYVPPGGWNPPAPVNGLRWWTVNSLNLFNGHWAFTATNTNPDNPEVSSVYFSTSYDGNSMNTTPQEYRDTYGWKALKGYGQFDNGIDTCCYVPYTNSWWLFSGEYCVRTNANGDAVTVRPGRLRDVWKGLDRIARGEFGEDERQQWAQGISCITVYGPHHFLLISGNRITFLDSDDGDFGLLNSRPYGLTEVWPAFEYLDTAGIMDGLGPKAVWWGNTNGEEMLFFVFHAMLFMHSSNFAEGSGFGFSYLGCPSNVKNDFYGWNAMFNYFNSPWPYPSC
ncbi:hypothetical protein ACIRQY_23095 [Streptomyces sp. NPDC101490]|uniref:hypothetical protein n=1 Tax=Streptomyces sp. NPDC101490 TaxID=3366143 RepID=UPI0037FDCBDF